MLSLIQCSTRYLKARRLDKITAEKKPDIDLFFVWHAHYFVLKRRKCLLFVNSLSLYPVIAVSLTPEELIAPHIAIIENLNEQLIAEGVSKETRIELLKQFHHSGVCKSIDRRAIRAAFRYERILRDSLETFGDLGILITPAELSLYIARIPTSQTQADNIPSAVFLKKIEEVYGEEIRSYFDPSNMVSEVLH